MSVISQSSAVDARLLRIEQAAQWLGCTKWFVRSLIWNGEISYLKCGKRLLLDKNDLNNWIEREKEKR